MSEEWKAAKGEVSTQQRQLDTLERFSLEKRGELSALAAERDALAREVGVVTAELREARRGIRAAEEDGEERLSSLAATNAALQRELGEVRARSSPLHAEVEAGRALAARLGEEVEALKRAKGELAGRLDRATGALQASGVAAREAAAGEARLARALEEAGRRHEATLAALAASGEAGRAKEGELGEALSRLGALSQEAGAAREEASAAQRDARALAEELALQRASRAGDREAWEARLAAAGEELRRVGEEGRAREAQHSQDMARRAEEVMAARREAEAAMEAAAGECNELGEVLNRMRGESMAAARRWEESRMGLERRVAELVARCASEERAGAAAEAEARARVAAAQEAHASATVAMAAMEAERDAFVADVRVALGALAGEFAAVVREREALGDSLARIVERMEEVAGPEGAQAAMVVAWYEEAKKTFLALVERVQGERGRAEAERDNVRVPGGRAFPACCWVSPPPSGVGGWGLLNLLPLPLFLPH